MNIREWVGPLVVGVVVYFVGMTGIRLYNSWNGGSEKTEFVAPASALLNEPLYRSIDVENKAASYVNQYLDVITDYGVVRMDSCGAVIASMNFVRKTGGAEQSFVNIVPQKTDDYAKNMFFVACDQKTPVMYDLIHSQDLNDRVSLVYRAKGEMGSIEKTFSIYKNKCKIDLELTVIPDAEKMMRVRLMWPSPVLSETVEGDFCGAVIFKKEGKRIKKAIASLDEQLGYFNPRMFGSENKYFAHAMVKDDNQFAMRAYYSVIDKSIVSILESAPITEKKTWNVSFYVGPKDMHSINAVSPEFEKSLDYGMLAFFTKFLMYLLEKCYGFVGNFGFAIIIVTIFLKCALLPFTFKGDQKLKKMSEYAKQLSYIEQKYKHDKNALAAAREELYREHGMPGIGGCLPLLLQMVVLSSLSTVINNSIALYKAPFIWWIKDLSKPDPFYTLSLLIFMGMLFTLVVSGEKFDFKRVVTIIFAGVVIAVLFGASSAGLALFVCVSIWLHIVQTQLQKVFA